jgi:hypothetical protein
MADLVALRTTLLNVLFKLANGQTLIAEEMQRLIDRADSDKLRKAREGSCRHKSQKDKGKRNPGRFFVVSGPQSVGGQSVMNQVLGHSEHRSWATNWPVSRISPSRFVGIFDLVQLFGTETGGNGLAPRLG